MLIAIICALVLVDVLVFATFDLYGWATTLFVAELAAAWFFLPPVAAFVAEQGGWWSAFIHTVPAYIGIGVAVAALKWVIFNFKVAGRIKEAMQNFVFDSQDRSLNRFEQFLKYVDDTIGTSRLLQCTTYKSWRGTNSDSAMVDYLTPHAARYIDRISAWIVQWPIVIISLLIEDILLKFSTWISKLFNAIFTGMSRYLIGNAGRG